MKKTLIKSIFLIFSTVFLLSFIIQSSFSDKKTCLLFINSSYISDFLQAENLFREKGGDVLLTFPPRVILGKADPEIEKEIIGRNFISAVYFKTVPIEEIFYLEKKFLPFVKFFNEFISGEVKDRWEKEKEIISEPLIEDALMHPEIDVRNYILNLERFLSPEEIKISSRVDITKEFEFVGNSDTMVGNVAVCLFFIESDGSKDPNLYTWTSSDFQSTYNKAMTGLWWWTEKSRDYGFNVSFSTYYYGPDSPYTQIGEEPILYPRTQVKSWVSQIMERLGYASGSHTDRVTAFNTVLRNQYRTDWAFSSFIEYNPPPAPDRFTDGYSAFAYLGGPYSNLLFRSFGWSFQLVMSHETGHIFWAFDEYYKAGYGGCTSCGPVNVGPRPQTLNGNCEYCNPNSVPCMMKNNADVLCSYTPEQVGWIFPYPPLNLNVKRKINSSLFRTEYLNELTWESNPANEGNPLATVTNYKIYRKLSHEGNFELIAIVSAGTRKYLDRYLSKESKYTYGISSLDSRGRESSRIICEQE